MPGTDEHETRLRDPAHRDQDGTDRHQGRFAERVRRQWNVVALHEETVTRADIPVLARAIHQKVGGDLHEIEARLEEFEGLERTAQPALADPLVKPGEPA